MQLLEFHENLRCKYRDVLDEHIFIFLIYIRPDDAVETISVLTSVVGMALKPFILTCNSFV
jgi:hypothetical protein